MYNEKVKKLNDEQLMVVLADVFGDSDLLDDFYSDSVAKFVVSTLRNLDNLMNDNDDYDEDDYDDDDYDDDDYDDEDLEDKINTLRQEIESYKQTTDALIKKLTDIDNILNN